jgi:hypothetical protein
MLIRRRALRQLHKKHAVSHTLAGFHIPASLNYASTAWKWGERAPSSTDISDEEQWETKPPRANVVVVPETVPDLSPQKDAQKDGQ